MGVFAEAAPEYLNHGRPCFPVSNDAEKRPLVGNWQKAGKPATRQWAEKYPEANVGLCCGPKTGLTVIDVDEPGDAPVADAISRYGEPPIIIRTASGKHHLWFRHNGEKRSIGRTIGGRRIDILGTGGYTVAPPSQRPDLFSRYEFVQGSLDDLDRLPTINPAASNSDTAEVLQKAHQQAQQPVRADGLVPVGERDIWLFKRLLREVRHVESEEDLRDIAFSHNESSLAEPLPEAQVEAKVRQALKYQQEGDNWASEPRVTLTHVAFDQLLDAPDAVVLLQLLHRYHHAREVFAVSPTGMAGKTLPGWSVQKVRRARDVLVDRGYLVNVHQGRARGDPSLWQLL
jgi:hypothetical protein